MFLEFAESTCPIFRATTPLSRGQLRSKRHGKLSILHCADQATIETIFRIIVSANQLSLYGAVANMCEEYESHHDRSGQLDKVIGQPIVLSEIKAEVPLDNDDPASQNFLLQQIKKELKSCHVVNILFQEMMDHHNRKDGSKETQKLDPCWKSRPVACMANMELRLNFDLWVKTTLTLGLEFLMDQINLWWIRTTTTQKFLKISLKNKRHNWMWKILHTDQRQKQTAKKGTCWLFTEYHSDESKELDCYKTRESLSLRTKFRRK